MKIHSTRNIHSSKVAQDSVVSFKVRMRKDSLNRVLHSKKHARTNVNQENCVFSALSLNDDVNLKNILKVPISKVKNVNKPER